MKHYSIASGEEFCSKELSPVRLTENDEKFWYALEHLGIPRSEANEVEACYLIGDVFFAEDIGGYFSTIFSNQEIGTQDFQEIVNWILSNCFEHKE